MFHHSDRNQDRKYKLAYSGPNYTPLIDTPLIDTPLIDTFCDIFCQIFEKNVQKQYWRRKFDLIDTLFSRQIVSIGECGVYKSLIVDL